MYTRLLQHLVGLGCGALVFLAAYAYITVGDDDQYVAQKGDRVLSLTKYQTYSSSDISGLARIASVRALDRHADVKFIYDLNSACNIASKLPSGNSALSNAVVLSTSVKMADNIQINVQESGSEKRSLLDACKNFRRVDSVDRDKNFVLTSSTEIRNAMKQGGELPAFLAVAR